MRLSTQILAASLVAMMAWLLPACGRFGMQVSAKPVPFVGNQNGVPNGNQNGNQNANQNNPPAGGGDENPPDGSGDTGGDPPLPPPAANVAFGYNINSVHDWDRDWKFVNLMLQNRGFTRPSGGAAAVGANGYPTEDFDVMLLTGYVGAGSVHNGTYHLRFQGTATVSIGAATAGYATIQNQSYDAPNQRTNADVVLNAPDSDGGWYLVLSFRNVHNLGDIRLISPGYPADSTEVFTQVFKNAIANGGTLRAMDLAETNNSTVANWSDRTLPTDPTQSNPNGGKGIAWEHIIRLANETGKDLWVNIPELATDDYVNNLALLLKSSLGASHAVYVEYSNELWNGQFDQFHANSSQAQAEKNGAGTTSGVSLVIDGSETSFELCLRRQLRRTVEISQIFRTVYGDAAMGTRVRVVLGGQYVGGEYNLNDQMNFLRAKFPQPPAYYLYGLAVAPYVLLPGDQSSSAQVLSAMQTALDSLFLEQPLHRSVASNNGLHLLAYEGGPDMTRASNTSITNDASLQQDGMRTLTAHFLQAWYSGGGELMNYFTGGASSYTSNFTQWGVTNFITQLDTPKMRGINQVLNAAAPALTAGSPVPGDVAAVDYYDYTNGHSGPNYVWGKNDGAEIDYLVRADTAGAYQLQLRYAVVTAGAQFRISVNGGTPQTVSLPVTGPTYDPNWAPNTFALLPAPIAITLHAGYNGVRIHYVGGQKPSLQTLTFSN